jgi:hypothetical protein
MLANTCQVKNALAVELRRNLDLFPKGIITLASHMFILQGHVNSKAVKENKKRNNDAINQPGGVTINHGVAT